MSPFRESSSPRLALLVEVGIPVGAYYLTTALGGTERLGLLVSAAGGTIVAFTPVLRARSARAARPLPAILAVGAAASLVVGIWSSTPRLLLVREAYVGVPVALAMLVSCRFGTPAMGSAYRAALAPGVEQSARWDAASATPEFRRLLRQVTAIWAAAALLASLAQVACALLLPVPTAVVATNLTIPASVALASIATAAPAAHLRRHVTPKHDPDHDPVLDETETP